MKKRISILAALALLLMNGLASAKAPNYVNFQGKLTNQNRAPISGNVDIKFSVYDAATGGTVLWSEIHTAAPVTNGMFNVLLGSLNPVDFSTIFTGAAGEQRWLEVKVSADPPMTPRQPIVSVPYSINSETANDVPSKDITPNSVTIPGYGLIINSNGRWVGDPTGLVGPQGRRDQQGQQARKEHKVIQAHKARKALRGHRERKGQQGPKGQKGIRGIRGPQVHHHTNG